MQQYDKPIQKLNKKYKI